jgi:superoxide dismutase, Cu-Zn family
MSITRNTLALAGVCAVIGLGVEMRAQQPATPAAPASGSGHGAGHGAGQAAGQAAGAKAGATAGAAAYAKLMPTKDSTARGEVTFTPEEADGKKGVRVTASFTGLQMGEHGFHIHEKGDCSAPDGASAGGHFNPATKPHAARDAAERHTGDLGNLKADPYGMARANFVDTVLALDGPNSIVGKAVIIHQNADDFTTQPTGNAGGRLACGVIELKKAGS